jgi:XTP/dITP diphosphohydrolase
MLQPWPPDLWQASFICVIALICPDGRELTFRGECSGMIASKARGVNGFGYDPIFYLPEYGKTMAELPPEVKHQISHRGRALRAAADFIQSEPRT